VLGPLCKPLLVMELPNKRLLLLSKQHTSNTWNFFLLFVSYNVTARSIISECNSVGQRMYDHQTMSKASLKETRLVFQCQFSLILIHRAKHRSFRANHCRANRLLGERTSFRQCNDTMHNTFFRMTGPIPNFSKKSISFEPLYKSKNDFWSSSCIMLAFKIGKKAAFVDNVAH